MRFYQLEAKQATATGETTAILETVCEWHGTERDAIIRRNELFKAGKLSGLKRESLVSPVDVPTDKPGLLKFLKDNVTQPVIV